MTKPDESLSPAISDRQLRAIDLLLTGESLTNIASTLDVSRQTVSGWTNHHAPFIAELNRRRHQHQLALRSRYEQAIGLALELVIKGLENGDQGLAVTVFRSVGRKLTEVTTQSDPKSISGVVLALAQKKEAEAMKKQFVPLSTVTLIEKESHQQDDFPEQIS